MPKPDNWLTRQAVAERLSCSVGQVTALIDAGHLEAADISVSRNKQRRLRVSEAALQAYLAGAVRRARLETVEGVSSAQVALLEPCDAGAELRRL